MILPLTPILFDNDLASPSFIMSLANRASNIRLMWELHGGLRSIELDWAAGPIDAYAFYKRYVGYRLVIADKYSDAPVADGFITGISITPTGTHVIASGFWFRHYDQLYAFDDTIRDSQQDVLTYESGAEFRDTGQDFSDWKTDSGDLVYKIEVGNLGAYQEGGNTIDTDNDFATTGLHHDREWYAQRFTLNSASNVAQVSVQLKKTGSPTGTVLVAICDESSGKPGSIVGSVSSTKTIDSDITTSYSWITWTWGGGAGPQLSAETPYYIVLRTAGYSYTDGVTELVIGSDADGGQGDTLFKYDDDASPTWTTVGTDHICNYRTYPDNINAVSWGFLGDVGGGGDDYIKVYRDYSGAVPGWLGDDPTDLTPIRYAVYTAYEYKTTGEIVKDALDEVPAINTDQDNIDDPGTVIGFWAPPIDEGGMYPGELIEKLASMSDSTNRQWSYWVKPLPFSLLTPQKPVPYFKAQVDDGTFDWQLQLWMLAPGTMTMERNIQELRNHVRIIYRNMDEEDALTITDTATDTTSISDYWQREAILTGGDLFNVGADRYRDLYLNKFKDALLGRTVTVTAPWIIDDVGAKWPLWFPIKHSTSYFQVRLYPDLDIFDKSWDRTQNSQAQTMEYNAATNTLRIVLDLEDNRLDALISRIAAFR